MAAVARLSAPVRLGHLQALIQLAATQIAPGEVANQLGAGLRHVRVDAAPRQVHDRRIGPLWVGAGEFHAGRFGALGVPPTAPTNLQFGDSLVTAA